MLKPTSAPQVLQSDTFYAWLTTTNICANALATAVLTSDSWGTSNTVASSGNVTHNGGLSVYALSANTVTPVAASITFVSAPVVLDSASSIVNNGTTKLNAGLTCNSTVTIANTTVINSTLSTAANTSLVAGAVFANTSQLTTGNTTTSVNLYVNGSAFATGDVSGFQSSDARLKININDITYEKARKLVFSAPGVEFDWKSDIQTDYSLAKPGSHDYGVIAQDIQDIAPELVTERPDGYLAVDYAKLVPFLLVNIRHLTTALDDLHTELNLLKAARLNNSPG